MKLSDISEDLLRMLKDSNVKIIEPTYNFNHLTFKVDNLLSFIYLIDCINLIFDKRYEEEFEVGSLFYRGQCDSAYELIPSIDRGTEEHVHWLHSSGYEYKMIREMICLKPDEFQNSDGDFNLLSKLQHYGLPTRLLDFTYNPLVALYFAVSKQSESGSGCRVVIHRSYNDDTFADSICGLYNYYNGWGIPSLQDLLEENNNVIYRYLDELYIEENSVMARPQYMCDREKRQQSIFMVFPNEIKLLSVEESEFTGKTVINMSSPKNKILDAELADKIQDEIDDEIFKDKLEFTPELRKISEKEKSDNYMSVIVDDTDKETIIRQLKSIGITKAFLFPEAEYIAEDVSKNSRNSILAFNKASEKQREKFLERTRRT